MSTITLRCEVHPNGALMHHVGELDGIRVQVAEHKQAAQRANGTWFLSIASLESAMSRILSCSAQFHTLAEARTFANAVIAAAGPNPTRLQLLAAVGRVKAGPDAIVDLDAGVAALPAAGPIVVVPCGAQKLTTAAAAGQLYTSPHFALVYRAACKLAAKQSGRVRILSALHGLVEPWTVIEPYDVKMGDPASIAPAAIAEQLRRLNPTTITTMLPRAYAEALDAAVELNGGPDLIDLYAEAPGIGYQRGVASRLVAA